MEKTSLYKATISTPAGKIIIAVDSTQYDVRNDIMTAAADNRYHAGSIKIGNISRTNTRALLSMTPVKYAISNGKPWAWIKRA